MTSWVDDVVLGHRRNGLVVDANVLLLHCVGRVERSMISKFKRTREYTIEDFLHVDNLWARFDRILTTPAILTEVSNLSAQIEDPAKSEIRAAIARIVGSPSLDEKYVASSLLCQRKTFTRFGLTDCGIEAEAERGALVLTDDRPLHGYIKSCGLQAILLKDLRLSSR